MTSEYLQSIWSAVAPALGDHLWQSTLFAAAAGSLTFIFRRQHARARYWIWLAASVKFLIPFSVLVNLGSRLAWSRVSAGTRAGVYVVVEEISRPFSQSTAQSVSQAARSSALPSLIHLYPVLLAVWLCGFLVVFFVWVVRWRRIATMLRTGIPLRAGRELEMLRRLERMAGVRKQTEIFLSQTSLEPGIFGILRPALLWPEGISERLEDTHLEAIIAHELWHVRRRDNLAAAVHMVVEAVFWFHPLVWWLGARLLEERERACDEEVLELGSERQVYAESILKVCEFCVGSPLACVSGVTGADLKKRIVHIMNKRITSKLDFTRKLLLGTAGLLSLAVPVAIGVLNATPIRAEAQSDSGAAPAFTSVSIKPSNVSTPTYGGTKTHMVKMMYSPEGFEASGVTLKTVIQEAYGVQANQILGGPDWLDKTTYDIEAKIDKPEANEPGMERRKIDGQQMLRGLLADRAQLALHREIKQLPSYALMVAEGGPKLHPAQPGDNASGDMKGPDVQLMKRRQMKMTLSGGKAVGIGAEGISADDLALQLSRQLGVTVVNKTGLVGGYDFMLNWAPDQSTPSDRMYGNNAPDPDPTVGTAGVTIFTALEQQLGLKLVPQQGPVETLVIDHIEQPSEQ
jgi:uncharacterized protein (TIGR03435 family)